MDQLIEDIRLRLAEADFGIIAVLFLVFVAAIIFRSIKIVPQSEKWVVERLGRLHAVLSPGLNAIIPFVDHVKHRVSVLERQLPDVQLDAITKDNAMIQVQAIVFYSVLEPEKTVYRIANVDRAITATVIGIIRSEIGKMDLDGVQAQRSDLTETIKANLERAVDEWGIVVTRAEIIDVSLDEATRRVMLQQLNAERSRRAQVTEANGRKEAMQLEADARLYSETQNAQAVRVKADAQAYATETVARAIKVTGLDAVNFQIAMAQVEAMGKVASGPSAKTIIMPADAADAMTGVVALLATARGAST